MISKPWFQIAAFVVFSNIIQACLFYSVVDATGSALAGIMTLMFCCVIGVTLLVLPDSATTGHKLLTITVGAGVLYFATLSTFAAFAMAGVMPAWYAYSYLHNNFALVMQVLTGLEIASIFINAGITRIGRTGDYIGGLIDSLYSAVFGSAYRLFHRSGV